MTNQEAIILLERTRPKDNNAISLMLNEALTMAIKALEQNESAEEWYKLFVEKLEQEPKWIPVSERLPETHIFYNTHGRHISSDYVLVTVRLSQNGFHEQMVTVGRYSNNDWKLLYGNICGSIKAWMPLPKPYEPQEERNKE